MNQHRTWVFTPMDFVAPWAICLCAAALCIWAAVGGTVAVGGNLLAMRVISGVCAAVFLAAIPVFYVVRSRVRQYHFVTKDGVYVRLGKVNRTSAAQVDEWLKDLVTHWTTVTFSPINGAAPVTLSEKAVRAAFQGVAVFFVDTEKLSVWGRLVRGYTWGKDVVIGHKPTAAFYTLSLFKHELSHVVLGYAGYGWDEATHHRIFVETHLEA